MHLAPLHGRHRPARRREIRCNCLTATTRAPLGTRHHPFLPSSAGTSACPLKAMRVIGHKFYPAAAAGICALRSIRHISQVRAETESILPNAIKIRGAKVVAQKLHKHLAAPSRRNPSHPRIWRYNGRQILERRAAPPLSLRMGIYLVIKYSADSIPIALPAYGDIPLIGFGIECGNTALPYMEDITHPKPSGKRPFPHTPAYKDTGRYKQTHISLMNFALPHGVNPQPAGERPAVLPLGHGEI